MNLSGVAGILRRIAPFLARTAKYLFAIWIFGLIHYSGPFPDDSVFNTLLGIVWFAALLGVSLRIRNRRRKWLAVLGLLTVPFLYYQFIRPSHNRDWEEPHARTAYAEVSGDTVTIHHFRSFDYDADGLPVSHWDTRSFDLANLRAMDFFMTHWDTEMAGHPIFSFDFGPQGHLAFTIEARIEKGESYSLLAGLYRRFETIYIPCEESDAVRVRTNFRKNENVHIYRTIATQEQARKRFMEFIASMNAIKRRPRFYNIVTFNCTTAVRSQMTDDFPMDWRVIFNGQLDELLYERGVLVSDGLPFAELRKRSYINPTAREHPEKEGFSERIREGVPGFE